MQETPTSWKASVPTQWCRKEDIEVGESGDEEEQDGSNSEDEGAVNIPRGENHDRGNPVPPNQELFIKMFLGQKHTDMCFVEEEPHRVLRGAHAAVVSNSTELLDVKIGFEVGQKRPKPEGEDRLFIKIPGKKYGSKSTLDVLTFILFFMYVEDHRRIGEIIPQVLEVVDMRDAWMLAEYFMMKSDVVFRFIKKVTAPHNAWIAYEFLLSEDCGESNSRISMMECCMEWLRKYTLLRRVKNVSIATVFSFIEHYLVEREHICTGPRIKVAIAMIGQWLCSQDGITDATGLVGSDIDVLKIIPEAGLTQLTFVELSSLSRMIPCPLTPDQIQKISEVCNCDALNLDLTSGYTYGLRMQIVFCKGVRGHCVPENCILIPDYNDIVKPENGKIGDDLIMYGPNMTPRISDAEFKSIPGAEMLKLPRPPQVMEFPGFDYGSQKFLSMCSNRNIIIACSSSKSGKRSLSSYKYDRTYGTMTLIDTIHQHTQGVGRVHWYPSICTYRGPQGILVLNYPASKTVGRTLFSFKLNCDGKFVDRCDVLFTFVNKSTVTVMNACKKSGSMVIVEDYVPENGKGWEDREQKITMIFKDTGNTLERNTKVLPVKGEITHRCTHAVFHCDDCFLVFAPTCATGYTYIQIIHNGSNNMTYIGRGMENDIDLGSVNGISISDDGLYLYVVQWNSCQKKTGMVSILTKLSPWE